MQCIQYRLTFHDLSPAAAEMVVGEGVFTTLSAIDRFRLPGWALMSANNLAAWTPPPEVRRVLIAADRGAVGEGAAARLDAGAPVRVMITRDLVLEPYQP